MTLQVAAPATLVALAVFAWVLDYLAAASTRWQFHAAFLAAGGLVAGSLYWWMRRRAALTLAGAYVVAISSLHFVVLSPVKPFTRFYDSLEYGMSPGAVAAALAREFPDGGRFPRPAFRKTISGVTVLNLDLNDGRYNAEVVLLRFEDDRLAEKEYHPD